MQSFSLAAMILPDSAAVGQRIGVELVNHVSLWVGVDNVKLEVK